MVGEKCLRKEKKQQFVLRRFSVNVVENEESAEKKNEDENEMRTT